VNNTDMLQIVGGYYGCEYGRYGHEYGSAGRRQRIIWMHSLLADTDVNMEANKPRSSATMDVSFLLNMDTQVVVEYGHAGHR
jgi:hypothetical protein